jgi:lipid A ethanolaminephosphotransferase
MTKYDLKYIDNFIQLKEHYKHKSMPEEHVILETSKALKGSEKNFIFIVKHGSHFQWEDSYPKEEKYFLPTLESSDALSLKSKAKALNSYLNSVKYNVDLFFKHFLKEIDFFSRDDSLIIYTADHGQSILEEGRTSTHCDSTTPPLSQGIVPLLLFTSEKDSILRDIDFKVNSYNHYQIFPTIQKLMGYDDIKAKTLFDKVLGGQKQIFVSGDIFGRVKLQSNALNLQ